MIRRRGKANELGHAARLVRAPSTDQFDLARVRIGVVANDVHAVQPQVHPRQAHVTFRVFQQRDQPL